MKIPNSLLLLVLTLFFSCSDEGTSENTTAYEVIEETGFGEEVEACEGAEMACEGGDMSEEAVAEEIDYSFEGYVALFEDASLPLSIQCFVIDTYYLEKKNTEDYKAIRSESGFGKPEFYPYKKLYAGEKFTVLMSVEESYLYSPAPVIETYDTEGNLISLKALDFKYEETETTVNMSHIVTVNSDLTFSFELEQEEYELIETEDENGNYVLEESPDGPSLWRSTAYGRIDADGKIIVEKENTEKVEA